MRRVFIALTVLIPALAVAGWMRTYEIGDLSIGRSVRQTTDGGYIIAGQSGDENQCDLLLIKTDSLGDTTWTRIYGGSGSDLATCVQNTDDGGYIVTGHLGSVLWLLKIDSNGDTVWTRTHGTWCSGNWVEQTTDGGYIITGNYDGAYLWLLKTDNEGYLEWQDTIDAGGTEIGHCVQQTTDEGYIVTGFWTKNLLLLKTDAEGDSVWMRLYGDEDHASRGRCVRQTSDGGYVMVGYTGPSGWRDIWLLKTDANGDSIWAHTYGGGQKDEAYEVQQTTDGGYIVVGETRSFGDGNYDDAWLLKTDSLGDTLWTHTYGGERGDSPYSVQQTTDGGYIISGSSNSSNPFTPSDVWLIKTDSLGYVGVAEPPVQVESNWEVISPIGPHITLRYTDRPQGFAASIYDATGRKVDEVRSASSSGTVSWGTGYESGVYFIKPTGQGTTARVIIIH